MSLKGKDDEIGTQNDELMMALQMITARLDALEIAQKPYNPVNTTDVRRIHQNPIPQVRRQAFRAPQVPQTEDQFGDYEDEFEEAYQQRNERSAPRVRVEDENLSSIKMKIPTFKGTRDPDLYLDWDRKVEAIFQDRIYNGELPVATWDEMKRVMRKRFVPSHFERDLQKCLQTLKQRSIYVDGYFKAMDMAMIQANGNEDEEATMERFLNGLYGEIVEVVEL
ncbi:hypothetical protein KY285_030178 [Solanum tuberosum]|nr:hypothetical protein KY285_030178 [Solanum tuberosum]